MQRDCPFPHNEYQKELELDQGDCVQLKSSKDLFQVIGVDSAHKRCWIRRWPLLPKGSPVFEVSIQQVSRLSQAT